MKDVLYKLTGGLPPPILRDNQYMLVSMTPYLSIYENAVIF